VRRPAKTGVSLYPFGQSLDASVCEANLLASRGASGREATRAAVPRGPLARCTATKPKAICRGRPEARRRPMVSMRRATAPKAVSEKFSS